MRATYPASLNSGVVDEHHIVNHVLDFHRQSVKHICLWVLQAQNISITNSMLREGIQLRQTGTKVAGFFGYA
jgi:hypothetical protein